MVRKSRTITFVDSIILENGEEIDVLVSISVLPGYPETRISPKEESEYTVEKVEIKGQLSDEMEGRWIERAKEVLNSL